MSKPRVAIVTVNYNGKNDTLEFLGSLKNLQTGGFETKVVVVDNGSTDGSVSEINAQYPDVDILQNGENEGFSGGYNRGMIYAHVWGADYILVINNDTIIKNKDLLAHLIGVFKKDPDIGLVSPKIYFAPGFEFHKERYDTSDIGKVIWYGGGTFDWKNIGSNHRGLDEIDTGQYNEISETEFVTGCCLMIKREVLEKVSKPERGYGFFDDNLFLYFEDTDFQIRVNRAGFKSFYDGETAIFHKASQTAGIGSAITDFFHTRNRLVMGFRYATSQTKFALIREAIKFLLFGRKMQRLGVWDFLLGKRGSSARFVKEVKKEQYQLELSISIVSYNTADLTKKLLQSIFKKGSGFDPNRMEVIVLDNGSEDNCQQAIREFLPSIKYLQNKTNEGFSKGYNKAISYSKGRFLLLLNADTQLTGSSLRNILKAAEDYEGNAVLGGKLFFPDKTPQDSVFHLPTISGAFKEYFLDRKGSYFMYMPQTDKPTRVEGLVMAVFLIPEKILNKVGLLDEGTFLFFEDIEYCRRLQQYNIPVYFIPNAAFIHHHGGATKRIGKDKAYELLQKGAAHYHGKIYYFFLSLMLRLGQIFGRVKTPIPRWVDKG